jgi:hypothetical protein
MRTGPLTGLPEPGVVHSVPHPQVPGPLEPQRPPRRQSPELVEPVEFEGGGSLHSGLRQQADAVELAALGEELIHPRQVTSGADAVGTGQRDGDARPVVHEPLELDDGV